MKKTLIKPVFITVTAFDLIRFGDNIYEMVEEEFLEAQRISIEISLMTMVPVEILQGSYVKYECTPTVYKT